MHVINELSDYEGVGVQIHFFGITVGMMLQFLKIVDLTFPIWIYIYKELEEIFSDFTN